LNVLITHERRKEWDPGVYTILSSTTTRDICYWRAPSRPLNHGIDFLWDPGIFIQMDAMLEEAAVANLVHSLQTPFKLLNLVGQPFDLKQFWAQLLLQCHLWCTTLNAFFQCQVLADLQYNSIAFCIWDPRIGTSSSISHWLQNLTAATENTPSSLQTPEPATWISQVSSAAYAWDPGTMLLLCKSICLFLLREEKENITLVPEEWIFGFSAMHYCQIIEKCRPRSPLIYWQQDIKFNGIPLWLINFQVP
jgi:hypothetical protein